MPSKSFSVYANDDHYQSTENDHLIIEVGNGYIVFLVKSRTDHVHALEWFSFKKNEEENIEELFAEMGRDSAIINQPFVATSLYVNNDLSVLVPDSLFKEDSINDYLQFVIGDTNSTSISYDRISADTGLVNVFRYNTVNTGFFQSKFNVSNLHHTYSSLLSKWLNLKNLPGQLLNVMFYSDHFIVSVFNNDKLMLMRAFVYHSADDVIYHLLTLSNTFSMDTATILLKVSGFIDIPSALHSQLTRFFKNVSIDTFHLGKINLRNDKYPLHYFTPVFNLAT